MPEPKVTVFIPVYNEEKHIEGVLKGLFDQDWRGSMEILLVDGHSSDGTVEIIERMKGNAPASVTIRILHNSRRHIPISLNLACEEATGSILVRLDGHTYPPPHFISRMVRNLESIPKQGTVGGCWNIVPANNTVWARACAAAVSHRFGIGNAAYRIWAASADPVLQQVDTVPFGAFAKSLWQQLGGYDESLLFDEDSDFNFRVRQTGNAVWLDPGIVFDYVARSNLKQLWIQYFRYGFWSSRFFWKHRTISSWRKLGPFTFVSTILLLLPFLPLVSVSLFAFHLGVAVIVAFREALRGRQGPAFFFSLTAAFWVVHWSYGIGNLCGLLTAVGTRRQTAATLKT